MNNPLVSVCVQTYNHAPYIRQCIEGILGQETGFPFEIIIGEDHSEDRTREICREYAERYPETVRLFLRSREDVIHIGGRPTGRFNLVENLKAARGTYIALCEGDDYWDNPQKLQRQVDFMEGEPDTNLCFTNFRVIDAEGSTIREQGWEEEKKESPITHLTILEHYVPKLFTTMFRSSALPEQFPEEFFRVYNADNFLFALVTRSGDAAYLDIDSGCYRVHEGGMWGSIDWLTRHERQLESYRLMRNVFDKPDERRAIEKRIAKKRRKLIGLYLKRGRVLKALKSLNRLRKSESDSRSPIRILASVLKRTVQD